MVVRVEAIRSSLADEGWTDDVLAAEVSTQVRATLAHEYGHCMAEAIRVEFNSGNAWTVPAWGSVFDDDEEAFAEDFARFLIGADCEAEFWMEFLPVYALEWHRSFVDPGS